MDLLITVTIVVLFSESGYTQNCASSIFPPDPKSGCCGHAVGGENKIGSTASIDEYPWMAIVEYQKKDTLVLLCGAALISGRYALSAGQCFSELAFKVATPVGIRLGEYETNNDGPDCVDTAAGQKICNDGAISIPIEKFTMHPEFNQNKGAQNDIVLVRLARMAPYTGFIRPICLPSSDITVKPPKRLFMIIAGWGAVNSTLNKSNVLRRIHVPYVDNYLCQYLYQNTTKKNLTLTNSQLCAGSKNRDACSGDSGGPLMYTKRQITEFTGIVSFGTKICGLTIPSVYTKVYAYKDWIQTTIEADERVRGTPTATSTATTTTPKTRATDQDFDPDLIFFRE